jgi:predicted transcriptional regulator
MKSAKDASNRPAIPLRTLQRAVSDPTRWKIFDTLRQRGPMTPKLVTQAVGAPISNISKHLVFLRKVGLLEQRMGKVYAIPEVFMVPGERALDFGAIVIRFDVPEAKR